MSYVYVIRSGEYCKIGIAADVQARLASLQTGNPVTLTLVTQFEFANPAPVEQVLHQKFASQRETLEWFRLSVTDLETIDRICRLLDGTKAYGKENATDDEVGIAESEGEDNERHPMTKAELDQYMSDGWRVEAKPVNNADGTTRHYYVLRRRSNGRKPTIYIGKELPEDTEAEP